MHSLELADVHQRDFDSLADVTVLVGVWIANSHSIRSFQTSAGAVAIDCNQLFDEHCRQVVDADDSRHLRVHCLVVDAS